MRVGTVKRYGIFMMFLGGMIILSTVLWIARCCDNARIHQIDGKIRSANNVSEDNGGGSFSGKSSGVVAELERAKVLRQALGEGDVKTVAIEVHALTGKGMENALAMLMELKPGWRMVRTFLSAWADIDYEECARWSLANLPRGGDRSFIIQYTLGLWVGKDVQGALTWAQTLTIEQGRESVLNALFEAWAVIDPESAAKTLPSVANLNSASMIKGIIAWHWAQKDVDAATAWAWSLPRDSGYVSALSSIARFLFETDKARASKWAKAITDSRMANPTLQRMAAFLTGSDSAEAVSMLAGKMPHSQGVLPEIQLFVVRWAARDPANVLAWAGQIAGSRGREAALSLVNKILPSSYQGESGNGAEMLVDQQASSDSQSPGDAGPGVVSVLDILNYDLSVAISLTEQLPDGAERDAVMHSIAIRWAQDDPGGAAAWVMQQMSGDRALSAALRAIIWNWTEKDSAGAREWAGHLNDAGKHADAFATIAMSLARTDPPAAADIVEQLSCGDARNNIVSNVAFQWARVDRNAAAEWAGKLTVEQGREQALAAISRAVNN